MLGATSLESDIERVIATPTSLPENTRQLWYRSLVLLHMFSCLDWNCGVYLHDESNWVQEFTNVANVGWRGLMRFLGKTGPNVSGLQDVAIRFTQIHAKLSSSRLVNREREAFHVVVRTFWTTQAPSDLDQLETYEHEKRLVIMDFWRLTGGTTAKVQYQLNAIKMIDAVVAKFQFQNVVSMAHSIAYHQLLAVHSGCEIIKIRTNHVQSDAVRFVRSAFQRQEMFNGATQQEYTPLDEKSIKRLITPYAKCRSLHGYAMDPFFDGVETLYRRLLGCLPLSVQQTVNSTDDFSASLQSIESVEATDDDVNGWFTSQL